MTRYAGNPLFWGSFFTLFVSISALCAVNGVQALNLAAAAFVLWFGFAWYRGYYIRSRDLFPPLPDGVLSLVSGVPVWIAWSLYGSFLLVSLAFLAAFGLWQVCGIVLAFSLLFAFLAIRKNNRA